MIGRSPIAGRRSGGQSAVEFALALPVFLWLMIGVFDLGRGVACYAVLENSAREGARAGIFPQSDNATILAAVNSQAALLGGVPSSDVTITPSEQSARISGGTISVQVVYRFQPAAPLLANLVGPTLTMRSSSTMMIE